MVSIDNKLPQEILTFRGDINYSYTNARMDIGSRIRQARIAAGLSQARLAELMGVTRSACSQWESPHGTVPRGRRLAELARLLNVGYEWLAMGTQGDVGFAADDKRSAETSLSPKQKELLRLYEQLPAPGQAALMKFLHACTESGAADTSGPARREKKKH